MTQKQLNIAHRIVEKHPDLDECVCAYFDYHDATEIPTTYTNMLFMVQLTSFIMKEDCIWN